MASHAFVEAQTPLLSALQVSITCRPSSSAINVDEEKFVMDHQRVILQLSMTFIGELVVLHTSIPSMFAKFLGACSEVVWRFLNHHSISVPSG